jgi:hypothetical protein
MIRVQIPLIVSIKTPTRHRNLRFPPLGKSEIGLDRPRRLISSTASYVPGRWWLRDMPCAPAQNTEKAVVQGQSNRPSPTSESMNREAIRRHLVQADNRVASGERTIARQWAIVTELARDSQDTSEAKSMIAAFEQTLRLQIADRNRIRAELACCW